MDYGDAQAYGRCDPLMPHTNFVECARWQTTLGLAKMVP